MEKYIGKHESSWIKQLVRTDKIIKLERTSVKYYILTVRDKEQAHRVNKTKISLEMTPCQRDIEPRRTNM